MKKVMKIFISVSFLIVVASGALVTVRNWNDLRNGLNGMCPDGEKDPMCYCPLITASKTFLDACPAILETLPTALDEDEQAIMLKYVRSLTGPLKGLARKKVKEDKLSVEEKEELIWGRSVSPYGFEIDRLIKEKASAADIGQAIVDSILKLLERMKDKKGKKTRVDFLQSMEKILDRLIMLEKSKKITLQQADAEALKKTAEAVELCRPFHQRNFFIGILTLVLLIIMTVIVGGYMMKTTRNK